jgi:hypothetical protein
MIAPAIRAGRTYFSDLVDEPLFTPQEWEQLVDEHLPLIGLLVAVDETDGTVRHVAAYRRNRANGH